MLNKQIDNSLKGGEPTPDVCAQPTTPADLAKFTFLNNGKGMLKQARKPRSYASLKLCPATYSQG